jgi:L-ascorbate metabolism protein UlaG (beta-lactamase superfamily)
MSDTNGYLDMAAILAADDIKVEELHIPEWGGTVRVRGMDGTQRDAFEESQLGAPYRNLRARLAVATLITADGKPMFTAADVPALAKKSARALDRIFPVATRLSGLSKEDVEELKKNSSETPSSDSSTS